MAQTRRGVVDIATAVLLATTMAARSTSLKHAEHVLASRRCSKHVQSEPRLRPGLVPVRQARDAVHGKTRRPREIKPLARPTDEMTCLRAPLEPLSPKSPEVVRRIVPLRGEQPAYPERWYKRKSTVQEVLRDARKEACKKALSHEEVLEWREQKRRQRRERAAEARRVARLEALRCEDRKRNCCASFAVWDARKRLQRFEKEMAVQAKVNPRFRMGRKDRVEEQRLRVQLLRAKQRQTIQLRDQKSLQALTDASLLEGGQVADEALEAASSKAPPRSKKRKASKPAGSSSADLSVFDLACARIKLLLEDGKNRLKGAFDEVDTSDDGLVSKEEFAAMLGSLKLDITPAQAIEVFSRIDDDGSGHIAYQELYRVVRDAPEANVELLRREDRQAQLLRKRTTTRHYESLRDRMPARVVGRLAQPKLYMALHTWKAASRGGMTAEGQRRAVQQLRDLDEAMRLLKAELTRDKARFIGLFRELDLSDDGTIDAAEFRAVLERLGMAPGKAAGTAKLVLHKIDLDRSGSIEYLELVRALKASDRERVARKMRRRQQGERRANATIDRAALQKAATEQYVRSQRPPTSELERIERALAAEQARLERLEAGEHVPPRKPKQQLRKAKGKQLRKQPHNKAVRAAATTNRPRPKKAKRSRRPPERPVEAAPEKPEDQILDEVEALQAMSRSDEGASDLLRSALRNYDAFRLQHGALGPRSYAELKRMRS